MMVSAFDYSRADDLIRRVSNKNYFTPLEPKHSLKPRIQRYSRILLRYPEATFTSASPVSVINYKDTFSQHSVLNLPKLQLNRRFSQVPTQEVQFPLDSPRTSSKISHLPSIHKSAEIPTSRLEVHCPSPSIYYDIPQLKPKETIIEEKSTQVILKKQVVHPVLTKRREEKFIQISHPKKIIRHGTTIRTYETKESAKPAKFVTTGENTDETLIGWEGDYSPEI